MTLVDREAILEEEIIILRNSGEIPEITLHSKWRKRRVIGDVDLAKQNRHH